MGNWLDPTNVQATGYDPEAKVSEFIQEHGQIGAIALEAWNAVDPLHCLYAPDEYLGYVKRFIEGAAKVIPSEWSLHLDLVEELVRRSFSPTQVCNHTGLGRPWVTTEGIKAISRLVAEGVEQAGGMEALLPES